MSIIRTALESETLSWAAKGLWAYLMGRPDNWNISVVHLVKTFGGTKFGGESAVYNLLKELIEEGYVDRNKLVDEQGRFSKNEYVVFEKSMKKTQQPHQGENNMSGFNHSFDTEDAEEYGVDCAILIYQFKHWILQNLDMKRNFIDGRTWTYQTIEEISATYRYFSTKQIRTILDKLTGQDVLLKGNFNKSAYDRTIWYAFKNEEKYIRVSKKDKAASQNPSSPMPSEREESICSDGNVQTGTPIPDTKPNTNKKTTTAPSRRK